MVTPPISYCRCIRWREVGSEWIFFYSKAFCHKEKLINFAFRKKMLYNIVIQHKTMGNIIACDNTNDKNT